jgi:MATE family multidrug resistance protein
VFSSYRPWQDFARPCWREIRKTLSLGLPIGLSLLAVGGFFSVVPLVMAELGTLAIAGHAVAMTFDSVMLTIPLGVGQAMSVRVAHELGGGDPRAARHVCVTGMTLVLGIAALQAGATVLAREPIAALFSADPSVRDLGAVLLVYAAAYRIFDSMQIGAGMALRGYKDTRFSSVTDICAYWVFGLPLCYALGMGTEWNAARGVEGFWLGMVIAISLAAGCIAARLVFTSARSLRLWSVAP